MDAQEYHEITEFVDDAKMLSHCVPIFILSDTPSGGAVYGSGTAALIDTGTKRVLVTCDHVWSELKRIRDEHSEARLATVFRSGDSPTIWIDDDSLMDCDAELDLAVFDFTPPEKALCLGFKQFYRIYRFPVADPRPWQPISLIGFPAEARRRSKRAGHFGYCSVGVTVSDVSHSLIVLANTDSRILRDGAGNLAPPIDLGGTSGAPAYSRTLSGGFNLVGFVRAGNNSGTDIRLSKAAFLRKDGSLFRPAWHRYPTSV